MLAFARPLALLVAALSIGGTDVWADNHTAATMGVTPLHIDARNGPRLSPVAKLPPPTLLAFLKADPIAKPKREPTGNAVTERPQVQSPLRDVTLSRKPRLASDDAKAEPDQTSHVQNQPPATVSETVPLSSVSQPAKGESSTTAQKDSESVVTAAGSRPSAASTAVARDSMQMRSNRHSRRNKRHSPPTDRFRFRMMNGYPCRGSKSASNFRHWVKPSPTQRSRTSNKRQIGWVPMRTCASNSGHMPTAEVPRTARRDACRCQGHSPCVRTS